MTRRHTVPLPFILNQVAWEHDYDGKTDDLLSGGAGFEGLKSKSPPPLTDPLSPRADDIRKRALWMNYRALMDVSEAYYGRYYGPGTVYGAPELIGGMEIMALTEGPATVMLQVPRHFNTRTPFLVTAPSSGSRGIYGGIGVVGEWALKRGFAVVYTDKGTGVGYHHLDPDRVCLIDGLWEDAEKAGHLSTFTAQGSKTDHRTHSRLYPHRLAVKHAHSGLNVQKDWGVRVLQSIEFARLLLIRFFPEIQKTLRVIAAGISNGGLASIMAREQDTQNRIDGLVVSEPNVTPVYRKDLAIVQGSAPPLTDHSRHLVDYTTLMNIYQPCASLGQDAAFAPFAFDAFGLGRDLCENRCLSLRDKGLLTGDSIESLARHAARIIRTLGILPDQEILLPSHYALDVSRSIALTYLSQLGRVSVLDHLCGYSFSAVNETGRPRALAPGEEAALFSDQSGIPPLGLIKMINDCDPEGPKEDRLSLSPSTGRQDMNLDGALALRRVATGIGGEGSALSKKEEALHRRVCQGAREMRVSGNLGGCPAIIVTGRSDAVIPVNHASRPYVGVNRLVERGQSRLHYYEVTRAHHVDALNMMYADPDACGNPIVFAPLHVFYLQALDRMVDHLDGHRPLPPSQVIRPDTPRASLPDILDQPPEHDRIRFDGGRLIIPD